MTHLIGFKHLPNINETSDSFLKEIYRFHGFPKVVITDRGTQFTSYLWKELLEFFETQINYATTNQHETVGQVERNNVDVETKLRCFIITYEDESKINYRF